MIVSDYLRNTLVARFPDMDFTPYFAFIESVALLDKGGHRHHILPEKEFSESAKDPENVVRISPGDHLRAHYYLALCAPEFAPFQFVFFLMAGRKKEASQINKSELLCYSEVFERGAREVERVARLNGQIQGRKNVESGHLADLFESFHTPEHQSIAGRLGGLKAVESGQIQALGHKFGTIAAERNRSSEGQAEGGRRRQELHGNLQTLEGSAQGGRSNVASGELARIRPLGLHTRWHVNRGLINPMCSFCTQKVAIPTPIEGLS